MQRQHARASSSQRSQAARLFLIFFSISFYSFQWVTAIAGSLGDVNGGNIVALAGSLGAVLTALYLWQRVTVSQPLSSAEAWPLRGLIVTQICVVVLLWCKAELSSSALIGAVAILGAMSGFFMAITFAVETTRAIELTGDAYPYFRAFGSLGYAAAAVTFQYVSSELRLILLPLAGLLIVGMRNSAVSQSASSTPHTCGPGVGFMLPLAAWSALCCGLLLAICVKPFESFGAIFLQQQAGGVSWLAFMVVAEVLMLLALPSVNTRWVLASGTLIWASAYCLLFIGSSWFVGAAMLMVASNCSLQTAVQADLYRACPDPRWSTTVQGVQTIMNSLGGLFCVAMFTLFPAPTALEVWHRAALVCLLATPVMVVCALASRVSSHSRA